MGWTAWKQRKYGKREQETHKKKLRQVWTKRCFESNESRNGILPCRDGSYRKGPCAQWANLPTGQTPEERTRGRVLTGATDRWLLRGSTAHAPERRACLSVMLPSSLAITAFKRPIPSPSDRHMGFTQTSLDPSQLCTDSDATRANSIR